METISSHHQSVGFGFNVSTIFKAFANLFGSVLCTCHSVASLGRGLRFISSVLRVCGLLFSVRSIHVLLLVCNLFNTSQFLGTPFFSVWSQVAGGQKEKKHQRLTPPIETTADGRGRFPLFNLVFCRSPIATAATTGWLWACTRNNRKKKKEEKRGVSVYFLEFLETLFPLFKPERD